MTNRRRCSSSRCQRPISSSESMWLLTGAWMKRVADGKVGAVQLRPAAGGAGGIDIVVAFRQVQEADADGPLLARGVDQSKADLWPAAHLDDLHSPGAVDGHPPDHGVEHSLERALG